MNKKRVIVIALVLSLLALIALGWWARAQKVFFLSNNENFSWITTEADKNRLKNFIQEIGGEGIYVVVLEKDIVATKYSVGTIYEKPIYYLDRQKFFGGKAIKVYINLPMYETAKEKQQNESLVFGVIMQLKRDNKYTKLQYGNYVNYYESAGYPKLIKKK